MSYLDHRSPLVGFYETYIMLQLNVVSTWIHLLDGKPTLDNWIDLCLTKTYHEYRATLSVTFNICVYASRLVYGLLGYLDHNPPVIFYETYIMLEYKVCPTTFHFYTLHSSGNRWLFAPDFRTEFSICLSIRQFMTLIVYILCCSFIILLTKALLLKL